MRQAVTIFLIVYKSSFTFLHLNHFFKSSSMFNVTSHTHVDTVKGKHGSQCLHKLCHVQESHVTPVGMRQAVNIFLTVHKSSFTFLHVNLFFKSTSMFSVTSHSQVYPVQGKHSCQCFQKLCHFLESHVTPIGMRQAVNIFLTVYKSSFTFLHLNQFFKSTSMFSVTSHTHVYPVQGNHSFHCLHKLCHVQESHVTPVGMRQAVNIFLTVYKSSFTFLHVNLFFKSTSMFSVTSHTHVYRIQGKHSFQCLHKLCHFLELQVTPVGMRHAVNIFLTVYKSSSTYPVQGKHRLHCLQNYASVGNDM